jgi:shikimate dehydrogenase
VSPRRFFGVIGDPVVRSVSPAMHRAAFAELRLDAEYLPVTVRRGTLAARLPALRERFAGLNVTAPLKEEALGLLDRAGPEAERAGSVNTLVFADGEVLGRSTDGEGFLAALGRSGLDPPPRAVVVGTGGAARAVSAVLADAGTDVVVAGRDRAAGRQLAARLGVAFVRLDERREVASAMAGAGLLANATPSDLPDVPLRSGLVVFDLVYRPRRTPLLRRAEEAGCVTIEGVEMLVEQGARSFSIWTGLAAPVETMRAAALAALDPAQMGGS